MAHLSALIVETDPTVIDLIRKCLRQSNEHQFKTRSAASLEAAQCLMAHYDFDAILVDPALPDAEGLEVVRRLVASAPEAALIVMTDERGNQGLAFKNYRFGAQDYLEKQHLSPLLVLKSILYAIEIKNILQEKEDLLNDFMLALKELDALQQILPMCSCCKKVQWNKNLWLDPEDYISRLREYLGSDLTCPDCSEKEF
jgi:DNA-binding NtrC family response regulator